MKLSDLELTAVYAALTVAEENDIFWEQDKKFKEAALNILDRIAKTMEKRKLLEE